MASYIDKDLFDKYFYYDGENLRNKVDRGVRSPEGNIAGLIHVCGREPNKRTYRRFRFKGKDYYSHRVIWVLVTGQQPEVIDHIDGDGLNNKWDNLRNGTHLDNMHNQKIHNTNTSGASGITYRKESNKWRARIMVEGKMISLGSFKSKDEAINARKEAEIKYWEIDKCQI